MTVIAVDFHSVPCGLGRIGQEAVFHYVTPQLSAYGSGVIQDVVSRLGIPGSYRVILVDRVDAHIVGETVSAADGTFSFHGLPTTEGRFMVFSLDDSADPENAAIADYITAHLP